MAQKSGNNSRPQKRQTELILEESMEKDVREPGDYFFKFQFFVHQLTMIRDFYNVRRPSVAVRFLDFPTLVIEGELTQDGRLIFEKGKSTSFKMHSEDLKMGLLNKPFFVMFIDADTQK